MSKYQRHQGTRERVRRLMQITKKQLSGGASNPKFVEPGAVDRWMAEQAWVHLGVPDPRFGIPSTNA